MKWALIGASNIAGEWMVSAIRAAGDEVVAVVSGDGGRAQDFAQAHGIARACVDMNDLPSWGVQAVYISSTNEKHEAQTLCAAQMGMHVLCEKPLATTLDAARRMVDACAQAGVVLATNHHLRHNGAHLYMRDAVATGELGALVALRVTHSVYLPAHLQGWRLTDVAAGGGVVLDIAVHNADSVAFILGEYPTHVSAMISNSGMATGMEDNAMSVWRMPSGVLVSTHQGFATPYADVGLEVHGTQASLVGQGVLHQGPVGRLWRRDAHGETAVPLNTHNLYERVVRHFHLAIQGEPNDVATGNDGLRSLAVAQAVLDSAQSGQVVEVQA
jgi:1,5-anhydro-D-fructose reductase (1,5-anhydro-D-mannitol-forming)